MTVSLPEFQLLICASATVLDLIGWWTTCRASSTSVCCTVRVRSIAGPILCDLQPPKPPRLPAERPPRRLEQQVEPPRRNGRRRRERRTEGIAECLRHCQARIGKGAFRYTEHDTCMSWGLGVMFSQVRRVCGSLTFSISLVLFYK